MAAGHKTGGRQAGTPNKRKDRLLRRLERDFPDYHPVAELAKIANDPKNDVATRLQANKEVAKYVEPQLKAVEHRGDLAASLLPAFIMHPPEKKTEQDAKTTH